jgi:lipoprotein-anchoring transpeptidase ErfK/SrfK
MRLLNSLSLFPLLLGGFCGLLSPMAIAQTPTQNPTQTPAASPTPLPTPLATAPGNIVAPTVPPLPPVVAPGASQPPAALPPGLSQPSAVLPPVQVTPKADVLRLLLKRGERRVYVYKNDKVVAKYPVAVGKKGWETPIGKFNVLNMEENPTFKSFKTGRIIPPGPDNPLGVRWIGIWTDGATQLGFHGTNEPELIGQAVSHGCIRMLNRDVVKLYSVVKEGVTVEIVP